VRVLVGGPRTTVDAHSDERAETVRTAGKEHETTPGYRPADTRRRNGRTVDITVLGAMTLLEGGCSYLPTAPKERQLTGLLLMNANRVVTTAACLEELWSDLPPRTARTTLQTYVMHVRTALGAVPSVAAAGGPHALLRTREQGYLLRVGPGQLDLDEFHRLTALGRAALADGDDATASDHLRAGLALWRGTPLADVTTGRILETQVDRLERTRLTVLEQCVAADLRLGRHQALLGELTALVGRHPVHEGVHRQYMLALYRCGRQVEALDTYRALVRRLRADLDLDLSAETQAVQRAILSADPVLDDPTAPVGIDADGPSGGHTATSTTSGRALCDSEFWDH
jgi:SARP family transcriptional regulator, regulator of embCAB operon